jgi:hypothetical protein
VGVAVLLLLMHGGAAAALLLLLLLLCWWWCCLSRAGLLWVSAPSEVARGAEQTNCEQ